MRSENNRLTTGHWQPSYIPRHRGQMYSLETVKMRFCSRPNDVMMLILIKVSFLIHQTCARAHPDRQKVEGVGTDYSLSLTTAWVRNPGGACEKVAGYLGLGGGFSLNTPVSSSTYKWLPHKQGSQNYENRNCKFQ